MATAKPGSAPVFASKYDRFLSKYTVVRPLATVSAASLAFLLADAILVPLRIAFTLEEGIAFLVFDSIAQLVSVFDVVATLLVMNVPGTEIRTDNQPNQRWRTLLEVKQRLLSVGFLFYALLYLPPYFVLLQYVESSSVTFVLVPRVLRAFQAKWYIASLSHGEIRVHRLVRILGLFLSVLYIAHCLGCLFLYIYFADVEAGENMLENRNLQGRPQWAQYIFALYMALAFLISYQDWNPSSIATYLWGIGTLMLGAGVFATIVGIVSDLIDNLDPLSNYFRRKLETLNDFISFRKINDRIAKRLLAYYLYLWSTKTPEFSETEVMGDMPLSLQKDIRSYMFGSLVSKVPFFKKANDPIFIERIVSNLKQVYYLPESYVVIKGTVGREMYFLFHGTVEVVNDDGTIVFATLTDGAFFGELSILFEQKRTASIRAVDMCEVYTLSKEAFGAILADFPERRTEIETIAQDRLRELKMKAASQNTTAAATTEKKS